MTESQPRLDTILPKCAQEQAAQALEFPAGDGFIWIAAEVSVARDLYRYTVAELHHPKEWVKAA